jgi:hypothetical protein
MELAMRAQSVCALLSMPPTAVARGGPCYAASCARAAVGAGDGASDAGTIGARATEPAADGHAVIDCGVPCYAASCSRAAVGAGDGASYAGTIGVCATMHATKGC